MDLDGLGPAEDDDAVQVLVGRVVENLVLGPGGDDGKVTLLDVVLERLLGAAVWAGEEQALSGNGVYDGFCR